MASLNIQPPEQFDFDQCHRFDEWIKRFERYLTVSKIAQEADNVKCDTLLYTLGPRAEEVFRTFNLSNEDSVKYNVVKNAIAAYCVNHRNLIFERAKFNLRYQLPDETIEHFINDLYSMAEHLAYGDLKNDLIRDKLVIGIKDKKLSRRLQLQGNLTLDLAVQQCRQSAQVNSQQVELQAAFSNNLHLEEEDTSAVQIAAVTCQHRTTLVTSQLLTGIGAGRQAVNVPDVALIIIITVVVQQ